MGSKLSKSLHVKMVLKVTGEKQAKELVSELKKIAGAEGKVDIASGKMGRSLKGAAEGMDKLNKKTETYRRKAGKIRGHTERWQHEVGRLRNIILLATFALGGFVAAMTKAVQASIQQENALLGLTAVASAVGESIGGVTKAAIELTETGLLSIHEAAAGLKNLLSKGFGMKEAMDIMKAFTDVAAFNRQGMLGIGEAVVGATEGLKNEMSMKVDNVGITKNLSIMNKEYADTIGTTALKLNQAQKNQAQYIGVMKEWAIFAGNAEKLTQTFSGALSKLGVMMFNLRAEMGFRLQPILKDVVNILTENAAATRKWVMANKEMIEQKIAAFYVHVKVALEGIVALLKVLYTVIKPLEGAFATLVWSLAKGFVGFKALSPLIRVGTKSFTAFKEAAVTTAPSVGILTKSLKGLKAAFMSLNLWFVGITAALFAFEYIYKKFNKTTKDVTETQKRKIPYDYQEIELIRQKSVELNKLIKITENINKKTKERISLLSGEIRSLQAISIQKYMDSYGEMIDIMGEEVSVTSLLTMDKKKLAEAHKRLTEQIKIQTEFYEKAHIAKVRDKVANDRWLKQMDDIVIQMNRINKAATTATGRIVRTPEQERAFQELRAEWNRLNALVLEYEANLKIAAKGGKALAEMKDRLRLIGGAMLGLTKKSEEAIKPIGELSQKLKDLQFRLNTMRDDIKNAFEPSPITTYDKLLKAHDDTVTRLIKAYDSLKHAIEKSGEEGSEKLLEDLSVLKKEIYKGWMEEYPEFKIEFAYEDLSQSLRTAMKYARAEKVLAEYLTGPAALEASKRGAKRYAERVMEAIERTIEGIPTEEGKIEFRMMIPESLENDIKLATAHSDALINVKKSYYDKVSAMDERYLEWERERIKTREKVERDLLDVLLYTHQAGYVSFKAYKGLETGVALEAEKLAKSLFDKDMRRQITLSRVAMNVANSVAATAVQAIADVAKVKAADASVDALYWFSQGLMGRPGAFAAAAGAAKAAVGYGALAGVASGVASGFTSRINEYKGVGGGEVAVEAPGAVPTAPTGIIIPPTGGLDLAYNPYKKPELEKPSGVNVTIDMSGSTFVGAGDAETLAPMIANAVKETVNEGIETGEINIKD